jgi:hypothetical protein
LQHAEPRDRDLREKLFPYGRDHRLKAAVKGSCLAKIAEKYAQSIGRNAMTTRTLRAALAASLAVSTAFASAPTRTA